MTRGGQTLRNYEMMTIVSPDIETEPYEAWITKTEKLITKNKGKIESIDRWGRKRLGVEIRHFKDGNYSIFYFAGLTTTVKEIDRLMKIDDDVLRFMIVRKPEKA